MGRFALTMVLAACSAGCYAYTPVRPEAMTPSERVRLTVTTERAAELEPALAGFRRTFAGTYVGREGENMLLEVQLRSETAGMSSRSLANRLSVPLADVISVDESSFSALRTAAAIGIAVAAVTAIGVAVFGGSDEGTLEEPPPIDNSVIFSIPIR